MHIEITTILPCPNKCSYCPQDVLMSQYGGKLLLTLEKFKAALSNIDKSVDIHFSGFGENFFNPFIYDMINYAHDNGYNIIVYTTTRNLDVEKLSHIKFKEFNLHDIGNLKNVPYKTTTYKIDNPISRGSNLFDVPDHNGTCKKYPNFDGNVMLPNGDVYLCCMDWGLKHKIGNIFTTKFLKMKRKKSYELCRKCEWSV